MKEIIKAFAIDENSLPFGVQATGVSYCDGKYYIKTNNSDFFTLEYILSGTGIVEANDQTYTAEKGTLVLLPKGRKHSLKSDIKDPWNKVWINFYGSIIQPLYDNYNLSHCTIYSDTSGIIHDYFTKIMELSNSTLSDVNMFNSISIIIHEIFIVLHSSLKTPESKSSQEMLKVKEFLSSNADTGVTMENVCQEFHISRSYLFKKFKTEYGITPHDYYQQKRIEIATQYLCYSTLSIKEISDYMKFADQHYFCNWFKTKTHKNPSSYRKNIRKIKNEKN